MGMSADPHQFLTENSRWPEAAPWKTGLPESGGRVLRFTLLVAECDAATQESPRIVHWRNDD